MTDSVLDFREMLRARGERPRKRRDAVARPSSDLPEDARPELVIGGDFAATVQDLTATIGRVRGVYSLGGTLVREAEDGVAAVTDPIALWLLSRDVRMVRATRTGTVPAVPTERATAALLQLGSLPGVPTIEIVRSLPCFGASGDVLQRGCAEGVLVRSAVEVAVPQSPSLADAMAARAKLLHTVRDFPFVSAADQAAWLGLVLTLAARPAIAGPCPMFAVQAKVPGTGKTLLCQLAGEIGVGSGPTIVARPKDETEMRKCVFSTLASASPFALIDNVRGAPLEGEVLEACLTGSTLSDRVFQTQRIRTYPARTVWAASGNNIALSTDLARRSLFVSLHSPEERPEDRELWDVLAYVREHRSELLSAALTIMRAWHVAGRPSDGAVWGSFEGWSHVIGGALTFVGLPNPVSTRRALRDEADDTRGALRTLLDFLAAKFPNGATTAEIVMRYPSAVAPTDTIDIAEGRYALERIAKPRYTANSLGYAFRALAERWVDGQALCSESAHAGKKRWKVRFGKEVETSPQSPPSPPLRGPLQNGGDEAMGGHFQVIGRNVCRHCGRAHAPTLGCDGSEVRR